MSQEITQAEADRRWGDEKTDLWLVAGPDAPAVRLRAADENEASARYSELCGIVTSIVPNTVTHLEKYHKHSEAKEHHEKSEGKKHSAKHEKEEEDEEKHSKKKKG